MCVLLSSDYSKHDGGNIEPESPMDSYNATACYSRVHTWPHSSAAMFHIQSRLAEGALPRAGCPFNSGASTVFRYWWASSYACIVTARMLSFAAGLVLPCFILGLQVWSMLVLMLVLLQLLLCLWHTAPQLLQQNRLKLTCVHSA
ncbi:hypothetical protein ABBQ38_008157 [Trebouxia sp. C0009 RCD-2024]